MANYKGIEYNIVTYPPVVFEKARGVFGVDFKHTIFAYSPNIHVASGKLRPDLVAHETTHFKQQEAVGGPEKWWEIYFENPQQRFEWELEAYRNQYKFIVNNYNKREHWNYLKLLGEQMVKMYNLDFCLRRFMDLISNPELSTPKV